MYVYDLQEMEEGDIAARLVRRSPYSYQETILATSVIWRSTATVSCVPSVIDYGRPDGSCTDMNGPVPDRSSISILVACTIHHRPYSGADPGFGIRGGGVSRRGIWGPLKVGETPPP